MAEKKKPGPVVTPAPRPVTAAARPVAAAPKPVAPVVSRPQTAPTVATPQRTALATMGAADRMEAAAVARREGITPQQASQRIQAQTQAQLAAQGTRSSRPVGGSADRMEEQQARKIYGTDTATARKIINTQVDVQRAAQGLRPVYGAQQKVAKIPAPIVRSSGPGSLMSGWQSTGPVSSTTGRPLVPNLPSLDASQDLRDQMGGTKPALEEGSNGSRRRRRRKGEPEEQVAEESPLAQAEQQALSAMIHESGGPMNLLEPVTGSERRATQIEAPERTVRALSFQPAYGPLRRRTPFIGGM